MYNTFDVYDKFNHAEYEDFASAPVWGEQLPHLIGALSNAKLQGKILEFGVYEGKTINCMAKKTSQKIYGFDSFEGLPEHWGKVGEKTYTKGYFKTDIQSLEFEDNVEIVEGYFDETIPKFDMEGQSIKLLHIDSDIYQSAKTVLTMIDKYIVQGTIIVFDELASFRKRSEYPHYEEHEWKALREWVEDFDRGYRILGRSNNLQATIMVVK